MVIIEEKDIFGGWGMVISEFDSANTDLGFIEYPIILAEPKSAIFTTPDEFRRRLLVFKSL